jgi:hypothetical protein
MYMPTKKRYHKSNKNKRLGKNTKKAFLMGGTCAMCGSCVSKMVGGNDNPPSFQGLPLRYFYPTNNHANDPNNPSAVSSVRTMPNLKAGGKKRNSSKKQKKIQKKGGMLGFSYLNAAHGSDINYNPLNTIGNLPSSSIASNIISGNMTSQNPSVLYQPVNDKYNQHNLPLA